MLLIELHFYWEFTVSWMSFHGPGHQMCAQCGKGSQHCRGWSLAGSPPLQCLWAAASGSLLDRLHQFQLHQRANSAPPRCAAHGHRYNIQSFQQNLIFWSVTLQWSYPVGHHHKLLSFTDWSRLQFPQYHSAHVLQKHTIDIYIYKKNMQSDWNFWIKHQHGEKKSCAWYDKLPNILTNTKTLSKQFYILSPWNCKILSVQIELYMYTLTTYTMWAFHKVMNILGIFWFRKLYFLNVLQKH